jgi:hypothetical protein
MKMTPLHDEQIVRVIDVHCGLVGTSHTGAVESSYLRIAGISFEATLKAAFSPGTNSELWSSCEIILESSSETLGQSFSLTPTFWHDALLSESDDSAAEPQPTTSIHRSLEPIEAQLSLSGKVWCILLIRSMTGMCYFMVIGRSSRHEGWFERLGLMLVPPISFPGPWFDGRYREQSPSEFVII